MSLAIGSLANAVSLCRLQSVDNDRWQRPVAVAELPHGIPRCNSVDHGHNGCTQRTGRHSQASDRSVGEEEARSPSSWILVRTSSPYPGSQMIGRMIAPPARMMSPVPLRGRRTRKLRFLIADNILGDLMFPDTDPEPPVFELFSWDLPCQRKGITHGNHNRHYRRSRRSRVGLQPASEDDNDPFTVSMSS